MASSIIPRENKANKIIHMKNKETKEIKEIKDTNNSKANTNNNTNSQINNSNNNKNRDKNKDKDKNKDMKKIKINNNNSNMIHQKMSNSVLIVHILKKIYKIHRKINIKILIEDFFVCTFWILAIICLFFCWI